MYRAISFMVVFATITGCGDTFGTLEAEPVSQPAVTPEPEPAEPTSEASIDNDGDGLVTKIDCNDADENIGVAPTWLLDLDFDGWGAGYSYVSCIQPFSMMVASENGVDCDDTQASAHPGGIELCDGLDNDCNGQTDEGVQFTSYADADRDGYGNPLVPFVGCVTPDGFGGDKTDCDDKDDNVHPGAEESCNGQDDDCDGDVDEAEPDENLCEDDNSLTIDHCDTQTVTCVHKEVMVQLVCELPDAYDPADGYICGVAAFLEYEGGQFSSFFFKDGVLELSAVTVCSVLSKEGLLHTNGYVYLLEDPFFTWVGGEQVTVEDSEGEKINGSPGVVTMFPGGLDFLYELSDFAFCSSS
jgi:hypothetical protein